MSRYTNRRRVLNNPSTGDSESIYQEIIYNRNIKQVIQYESPVFPKLTVARRRAIDYDSYIWKRGDRLYKVAYEYYGDSSLWYLIAWFNQSPTESHIDIGDTIMVPIYPEMVTIYFNR